MATFPSIRAPSRDLGETYRKPQIRKEFESGHTQSRPRATVGVIRWSLKWKALSEADYQTLLTFFAANVGGTFTWTHPISSTSYTVEFIGDDLNSQVLINGYRDVEIDIQSVP